MKKFVFAFTILLSSFFFFNSYVKASDPFIVNYDDNVLSSINEEFFTIRNLVIDFANQNSYNYMIWYNDGIYRYFFVDSSKKIYFSTGRSWFENSSFLWAVYTLNLETEEFILSNSSYNFVSSSSEIYCLLDSNIDIYYDPYSLNINYSGNTYVVDSTTKLKTIYDIYLEFGGVVPVDPHQEEIDKVGNFYTLCIDKLKYLSEVFLSNYIYLSIIVIFIIIFVFKLIFRRFL